MKKKWISVIRKDGTEKRFRMDRVFDIGFSSNNITICLADLGWKKELFFSLPTSSIRNAKEGDQWGWDVVTKEELKKLRAKLQAITTEC